MKHLILGLICVLSLSSCKTVSLRQTSSDLQSNEPSVRTFQLKSGQKVLLPLRSENLEYVLLQGSADPAQINKILKPEDLKAHLGADGKASLNIFIGRYNSSTFGPFQEVLVLIGAESIKLKDIKLESGNIGLPAEPSLGQNAFFVWTASVDSNLALATESQVWGLPSTFAKIRLETEGADRVFSLNTKAGKIVFQGKCGSCSSSSKQKIETSMLWVTSYRPRRSFIHVRRSGPTLLRPFDVAVDTLDLKPKSKLQRLLKKVSFEPRGWYVGQGLQSIVK